MHGSEPAVRGPHMGRWLLLAALLLLGIALFFWYAPTTQPTAPPAAVEGM